MPFAGHAAERLVRNAWIASRKSNRPSKSCNTGSDSIAKLFRTFFPGGRGAVRKYRPSQIQMQHVSGDKFRVWGVLNAVRGRSVYTVIALWQSFNGFRWRAAGADHYGWMGHERQGTQESLWKEQENNPTWFGIKFRWNQTWYYPRQMIIKTWLRIVPLNLPERSFFQGIAREQNN